MRFCILEIIYTNGGNDQKDNLLERYVVFDRNLLYQNTIIKRRLIL